ncbi:MAG TPA: hypothetical protein PK816_02100 [Candidatus Cloacimonadota bacterium]|nr:hypothetical protein [Candidatus Cloacimonadota bacterium]
MNKPDYNKHLDCMTTATIAICDISAKRMFRVFSVFCGLENNKTDFRKGQNESY